jgi:uncharacterized protein YkwD
MSHSLMTTVALLTFTAAAAADDLKMSDDEKAVIELTNAERKKTDLPPLKPNPKLFVAARAHAANMAKQDKLAHELDDATPADRITAAGYKFRQWGENVGWKYETPKAAVAEWMDSPIHKDNILNKDFTEIGVAVAKNEKGEPYWVQVFAAPHE